VTRRQDRLVGLGLFAAACLVLGWDLGRRALFNGDDAIYASFAREMLASGDPLHLRFDGEIIHQRPPLYPWLVTLALAVLGEREWALRLPALLSLAACAPIVYALGLRLFGPERARLPAAAAALLLPTLALAFLYGRATTSDATLTLFCLLAMWAVVERRFALAGAALGLSLMTKQIVGALPLVAFLPALVARGRAGLPARRELGRFALAALAVWAPWHLVMLALHGGEFVRGYIGFNVIARSTTTVLQFERGPGYYLEVLWQKERWIALLFVAGALAAAWRLAREPARREHDLLLLVWPLAVLVPFSLVRTKVDYYLLPAYPALALLAAAPLVRIPRRAVVAALGAVAVAASFALHVPRRVRAPDPFAELAGISRLVRAATPPDTPFFVIDELYLVPRWYADRTTFMIVTSERSHAIYRAIDPFGRSPTLVYTPPAEVGPRLAALPRWVALADRRRLGEYALPSQVQVLTASPRYLLFGAGLPAPPGAGAATPRPSEDARSSAAP
jgi:4-amino-4-deoxy-L-arabinose transferase-like glycosyltransferase